jgi:DNA-binding XRE family transcriptional regulator
VWASVQRSVSLARSGHRRLQLTNPGRIQSWSPVRILIGYSISMSGGRPPTSAAQRARARALQQRLLERTQEREVTREFLARTSDINRRTLDKFFEADSPNPSFFLVVAIARALSLDLNELAKEGGRRA